MTEPYGNRANHLTPRELEVLGELATGASNQAIGVKLFIDIKTVAHHTLKIYDKLELYQDPDINQRVKATLYYLEHGGGKE